jgi:mRNA interferase RelE/StbE
MPKKIFVGCRDQFTIRIAAPLTRFREIPDRQVAESLPRIENDWRIRVGDYRVIYEIADADQIVRINRIRHRREVYR